MHDPHARQIQLCRRVCVLKSPALPSLGWARVSQVPGNRPASGCCRGLLVHRRSPTATRPHSRLPLGFAKIIDLFTETHARAVGSKKAPAAPAKALLPCMTLMQGRSSCAVACVCSSQKSLLPPRASDGQSCTPSAHHRGRPGVRCWSTPPTGAACSSLPLPRVLRGQSGRLVGRVVLLDLGGVHLGGLRRGLPVPAAPLAAAAHAPPRRFGLSHFFTYFEFGNSPFFDFGILRTSRASSCSLQGLERHDG